MRFQLKEVHPLGHPANVFDRWLFDTVSQEMVACAYRDGMNDEWETQPKVVAEFDDFEFALKILKMLYPHRKVEITTNKETLERIKNV